MLMKGRRKRLILAGAILLGLGVTIPPLAWLSLTHQPTFYRAFATVPKAQREAKARRFVAGSLQLRNDITNERDWQAVFTDGEVNAWLAEDLVTTFADQIPPEVHEPRIAFEPERITLAFQLDRGPIRSMIWVVVGARVPEDNVLALTLVKIRAGVIPISSERIIESISDQAREHGLNIEWTKDEETGLPIALIRFPRAGNPPGSSSNGSASAPDRSASPAAPTRSKGIPRPPNCRPGAPFSSTSRSGTASPGRPRCRRPGTRPGR